MPIIFARWRTDLLNSPLHMNHDAINDSVTIGNRKNVHMMTLVGYHTIGTQSNANRSVRMSNKWNKVKTQLALKIESNILLGIYNVYSFIPHNVSTIFE